MWSYYGINNESERIKSTASIIASFVVGLLTTSLVYYNFYQMPEFAFTGFLVEPIRNDYGHMKSCASEQYLEQFAGSGQLRNDKYSKKYLTLVKIVKCNETPEELRISNDVTNIGLHTVNLHEIRYYITYPTQYLLEIKPKRISLKHEERETILHNLSVLENGRYLLKGGVYRMKFEVIGAATKFRF